MKLRMNALNVKRNAGYFMKAMCFGIMLMGALFVISQFVPMFRIAFAAVDENAKAILEGVLTVIRMLAVIGGGIIGVFGGIQLAASHMNDNGQEKNKAIWTIAAGVVLVALGGTLTTLLPWNKILESVSTTVTITN